jgi:hypothetical protein
VLVTTQTIVGSIVRTLESEVLPEAPPGWPASYLRSAIMLLTYLEDLVTMEPELRREDDDELRALLENGAAALATTDADPELAGRLRDAAAAPETDTAAYEARRRVLCELIVRIYAGGTERPPAIRGVAESIAEYRERSLAREAALWRRAELLPLM